MKISGTDISEYGLRLLKLTDYYNLPARKQILGIPAFGDNDIKYEPRRAVVTLFGKYKDQDDLATAVNGFRRLMQSNTQHDIVIGGRNVSVVGVPIEGFRTTVKRNTVIIDMVMVIWET
ncbi:MAG: hypothetical protein BWX87_00646 [Bacteroidetes bacterium ADurb.Bin123]|jgi:hypothetical protein|nr:MAG: hypothetical protein BWX87_00646 [Bacteroidetes bacterium ADurb.Bin123]HPH47277.1 hypothetical protein [Chryseolinea sp.]